MLSRSIITKFLKLMLRSGQFTLLLWTTASFVGLVCTQRFGDKCLTNCSQCFYGFCASYILLPSYVGALILLIIRSQRSSQFLRSTFAVIFHQAAIFLEAMLLAVIFRSNLNRLLENIREFALEELYSNKFFHPSLWSQRRWFAWFILIITWKGLKIIVHTYSYYWLTNPHQPVDDPKFQPHDVTVIITSIGPFGLENEELEECVSSILTNEPAEIIISTQTPYLDAAMRFAARINRQYPGNKVQIVDVRELNKRAQFLHGVAQVGTQIVAYADDHVVWPPTFLRSVLAPFEVIMLDLLAL
jgi:hypothetical protein